jgi:hypothetical protein
MLELGIQVLPQFGQAFVVVLLIGSSCQGLIEIFCLFGNLGSEGIPSASAFVSVPGLGFVMYICPEVGQDLVQQGCLGVVCGHEYGFVV